MYVYITLCVCFTYHMRNMCMYIYIHMYIYIYVCMRACCSSDTIFLVSTRLQGGRCAAQPIHTNAPKAESTLYAVNSLLQNAARALLKSKSIEVGHFEVAFMLSVGFCFVLTSCRPICLPRAFGSNRNEEGSRTLRKIRPPPAALTLGTSRNNLAWSCFENKIEKYSDSSKREHVTACASASSQVLSCTFDFEQDPFLATCHLGPALPQKCPPS